MVIGEMVSCFYDWSYHAGVEFLMLLVVLPSSAVVSFFLFSGLLC